MMKRIVWILSVAVGVVLMAVLVAGAARFGIPVSQTTTYALKGPWEYETSYGGQGKIQLPCNLELQPGMGNGTVILHTVLPRWTEEGYALQFESAEQTAEVYIGEEKRYTYGAEDVNAEDFVYVSAKHINQIPLMLSDRGKEVRICLKSPSLFSAELGLLGEVWIGTQGDLLLRQISEGIPYILIGLFVILLTLSAALMLLTYRGAVLAPNFALCLLAVMAVLFYNAENTGLWAAFHYSPVLSSLVDWGFYYLDSAIPIAAWLVIYVDGYPFFRWQRIWACVTGGIYIATVGCSLLGWFNFHLTRPLFMASSCIMTLGFLFQKRKSGPKLRESLAFPVFVYLTGYYLDYLKYVLVLLPVVSRMIATLQMNLSAQFYSGIALIIFPLLTMWITMNRLTVQVADTMTQAATAELQAKYAIAQYESVCQSVKSVRQLKHDIQHHFRTVATLLQQKKEEEAERYLAGLTDMAGELRPFAYCKDHVADITIGWYAEQFAARSIPFQVDVEIPGLPAEANADICCVLSNALQNALEGSSHVSSPQVWLWARPKGAALRIRVENKCCQEKLDTDHFSTSKKEKGHGLGLSSIKAAAQRCDGFFQVQVSQDVFQLIVVLNHMFHKE
ncbi:MAG: GHKL domain-containing protein [Eubacteriales bacterium]|nr:GHKL domain-containing protein [Eubacteriales bacterium]